MERLGSHGFVRGFAFIIICVSRCILAYSGIESVVQTAGLTKSWRDTGKAYIFLAVTTGIFTPLISALVLSSGIDPAEHETDLITQFAAALNGIPFGMIVGGDRQRRADHGGEHGVCGIQRTDGARRPPVQFHLDHQDQQPAVALP